MEPIHILPGIPTNVDAAKNKSRQRSNEKIGTTIAIMTVSFYVTWTPFAIRCVLGILQFDVIPLFSGLALLFAKLGVIVNPLLYIFQNQEVSIVLIQNKHNYKLELSKFILAIL